MENLTYSNTIGEPFTITSDSIFEAIKRLRELDMGVEYFQPMTNEQMLRAFYGHKTYEEKIHPILMGTAV